ncbi:hypothetical protein Anapl_10431 [Anas platyrhynchos]|uniref:Uncharacterized protein n=1 Tax=Anas platyrhynchos TaxID=8839 RepID=R0L7I6_ANAPL|nr:hypothetical protein Anapl_10431 [Anas platyrhynchos]
MLKLQHPVAFPSFWVDALVHALATYSTRCSLKYSLVAKDPIGDETVNKSLLIDSHCEASSFCATFSLNSLLIKIIQAQAMLIQVKRTGIDVNGIIPAFSSCEFGLKYYTLSKVGNVGSIALLLHVSFALMSLGKVPYVPCFGPAFLVAAEHFLPDWMMTCHLTIARKSLVGLIHMKEKMAYIAQLTESRISQETSYEKLMNLI